MRGDRDATENALLCTLICGTLDATENALLPTFRLARLTMRMLLKAVVEL